MIEQHCSEVLAAQPALARREAVAYVNRRRKR